MKPSLKDRESSLRDPKRPIVAIGSDGSVTKANAPARKMLDEQSPNLEGRNLGALVASFFTRHHSASGVVSLAPIAGQRERGSDALTIVLSNEQSADAPGSTDTTDADAQQSLLDKSDRRLVDYVAHELTAPLSSIKSLSRILRLRYDAISEADRTASFLSIEADAERALLILEALVNIAQRLRRPVKPDTLLPLHAVLPKVVAAHRSRNPARSIVISGDSPIYALADSMTVELALANLLNNAEKYAPRNTSIAVSAHHEGNRISIIVVNEGESLTLDQYKNVWDMYSRSPDAGEITNGSGIGLALCKELIEAIGGRVWAGPKQGGGSVCAITLPTSKDALTSASPGAPIC